MAYTDIYTAATDDTHVLRKQVAVACSKAAYDISNEDPETANHANRFRWARKVLASNDAPLTEAGAMIWKVLENAVIQAAPDTSPDGDVLFVVISLVDVFANR